MESQPVLCPNCSTQVPADNINITALLGKCSLCSHVFRLPMADLPAAPAAIEVPSCPSGIMQDTGPGGELYLRRSWFSPQLIFLAFFCVFWDGFLIFWYSIALFGNAKMQGPGPGDGFWMMVLFPLLHVAVGVGLTYSVVAGFLNKTQILVDTSQLHVRHQPVPWWGNRIVNVDDIQEFELDRTWSNNGEMMHSVSIHHVDGRQITLLSSLRARQAEFIGAVLADRLEVPLKKNFSEGDNKPQVPDLFKMWKNRRKRK
ncbi:MAG TPA: hypothetical protein VM452_00010 [Caulifigura sp.]|nr:hypothetical protein [Caulifigura sp.]